MTTTANPLSLYSTRFATSRTRWAAETADVNPPNLWRSIQHLILCNDYGLGLAEGRRLSGVLLIRARHAYPMVDWEWRD
jgi:hypothetical protein